ncbi:MAG: DUF2505 domain-containing protein [Actinomycetota bacterium]
MDFEIEHRIEAPVEEVAEALLDPGYQASLDGIGALGERSLVSQESRGDGEVIRRVRCVLGVDPGPAKRFLGGAEPAWIEEARWDPETLRWGWVIHPEVGRAFLRAEGAIELLAERAGTRRRVTGKVEVRVPGFGARVESIIVDGIKAAYADEAERLSDWVRSDR